MLETLLTMDVDFFAGTSPCCCRKECESFCHDWALELGDEPSYCVPFRCVSERSPSIIRGMKEMHRSLGTTLELRLLTGVYRKLQVPRPNLS